MSRSLTAGCNCGSGKKKEFKYVYTSKSGEKKEYNSEVEARAAQIKNGGGTWRAVPR